MPKRASIEFEPANEKDGLWLKFGGEPFGLPISLWPASRATGDAMQFICQIPLDQDLSPGVADAVAYLFMTLDGDETWDPDAGENALVLVPRTQLTSSFVVGDAPRLSRMVKKWWKKLLVSEPCIFTAKLTISEDPIFIPEDEKSQMPEAEAEEYWNALGGNKLGGSPGFIQGDELPFPGPWHLLLQLDSACVPFQINFGDAGVGYAFINGAGTEGKFLWQCS